MIIGIPMMGGSGPDDPVGEHFGRVPFYLLYDTDKDSHRVVPNTSDHMGGMGYPAQILSDMGIDVLVCRDLGRRAVSMFEERGVQVFVGAEGTAGEALKAYKNGSLQKATDDNACKQHTFRGVGGGMGHEHRH